MAIIISKKGKSDLLHPTGFEGKEDVMQQYVLNHPESIPIYDIQEDKRLFVVAREYQTESGRIDALAVDGDGDIYIVETKLYKNPDKRTVIAQALDYGASLWKRSGDFGAFIGVLEESVQHNWKMGLKDKLKEFFAIDDEQVDRLLEAMSANLREGSLKFVVLMDSVDERLKDLITYVNQNSQFDIYAAQLEYYKHDEYEIVIPKLFGAEVKKDPSVAPRKRKTWDETAFFDDAKKKLDPTQLGVISKLYKFSKERADDVTWGTGETGSFNPKFSKISAKSLYTVRSDGGLRINFGWLMDTAAAKRFKNKFKMELDKIKGVELPEDWEKRWVDFPIDKADDFMRAVATLLGSRESHQLKV
jgi:hypothetical protein